METVYFTLQMFLVFLFVCTGIHGETNPDPSNDEPTLDMDPSNYSKRQYLWFGPRLGRNKRNPADDDSQFKDVRVEDSITDLIKDSPWALIPLRGSDRNVMNFTPRLGRNSDEEVVVASSPPFSPRMGRRRHVVAFSPRLGRTANSQGTQ